MKNYQMWMLVGFFITFIITYMIVEGHWKLFKKKKPDNMLSFEKKITYRNHIIIIWVKQRESTSYDKVELLFDIGWNVNENIGRYTTSITVDQMQQTIEELIKAGEKYIDSALSLDEQIQRAKKIINNL